MEVAQISRTIARALKLNEDLAESIALAHDLGHTPFGHAGERELNDLLTDRDGFEHNRQSLRVVDVLERNYQGFPGINLTWETREGIIKHSSQYDNPDYTDFEPALRPSLEAQIIDIADEIAYNNHDLDDGLSSGLIRYPQIRDLALWKMASEPEPLSEPGTKLFIREIIRKIINLLVTDLIETSLASLRESSIRSYEDVRNHRHNLIGFSEAVREANSELKSFLRGNLYNHYRVTRMTLKARKVVNDLFNIYTENPAVLPEDYQERADETDLVRTVTDYIAGMTDRFALEEHRKLMDPQARV
jgi:dGTPase